MTKLASAKSDKPPKPSSKSMSNLPVEICQMIVSQVLDDQRTLHTLLLVSQSFLGEACRALYRTIRVRSDQYRNRLPLSTAMRRKYYGPLVHSFTVEPRRAYFTTIRPILVSAINLKELYLLDGCLRNVGTLLHPNHSFQLTTLEIRAHLSVGLLDFFYSQPTIQRLHWNPMSPECKLPSDAALLPSVVSLMMPSSILCSPWFLNQTTVRHLWCIMTAGRVELDHPPSEASRRLTSFRITHALESHLEIIPSLFPNLRYLDARYISVKRILNPSKKELTKLVSSSTI